MSEVVKSQLIKIKPNAFMRRYIDRACDYRRYCWNLGLEIWQKMYEAYSLDKKNNPYPTGHTIRNLWVEDKDNWEYMFSSRVMMYAMDDLDLAWQNYLTRALPDWGKPKFKSKKKPRQGFKTDRARIINGELVLDRPADFYRKQWHSIKLTEKPLSTNIKIASIIKSPEGYYVNLIFKENVKPKVKTGKEIGLDLNTRHYDDSNVGRVNIFPVKFWRLMKRINYYQRLLTRKRQAEQKNSNNFKKVRTKLRRDYRKAVNIQEDVLQKYTTKLVSENDVIVIEDLNVRGMLKGWFSKQLQWAAFGKTRRFLEYKSEWYGKKLIVVDKFYPSTQRCSNCGWIKRGKHKLGAKGNKMDHEGHSDYICQHCGIHIDRDYNAALNLLAYSKLLKEDPEYLHRICRQRSMN